MGFRHYFTAKHDFLILRVRFQGSFFAQEYHIITKLALLWIMKVIRLSSCAILSEQKDWLPIRLAYFIIRIMQQKRSGDAFTLLKSSYVDETELYVYRCLIDK